MTETTVWELEDHTAAKHEILRRYLAAWFPILSSSGYNRRGLFIDGFAGPGIYSKGELGSPIIALRHWFITPFFKNWLTPSSYSSSSRRIQGAITAWLPK